MSETTFTVYIVAAASVPAEDAPVITEATISPNAQWGSSQFTVGETIPVAPEQPALGIYLFEFEGAVAANLEVVLKSNSCPQTSILQVGANAQGNAVPTVNEPDQQCPYIFKAQSLSPTAVQFEYGPH